MSEDVKGRQVIELSNGDRYEGTTKGRFKDGYGIYRYSNGD